MEDLITAVTHSHTMVKSIDVTDMEFLHSVGYQIGDGKQLSTRQCYAIRSKLRQYIGQVADLGVTISEEDFRQTIEANVWRSTPKIIVEKRSEIRYLGDNLIALSYTAKKDMHRTLTSMGAKHRDGLTILSVNRSNIESLIEFLGIWQFEMDAEVEDYLALCLDSKNQQSHLICDGNSVVCNVCDAETLAQFILHVAGGELI